MTERAASYSSLAARLLQAQDDERRRISRDLHDSVGQSLAALKMELSQAARIGDGAVAEKLQNCIRCADEAVRELRAVSFLLHPPLLDLTGLVPAIRDYAQGFDKRSDMTICVETPDHPPRLSSEKETALFRVLQECLTNAHRHSQAKYVWIRIKAERRDFLLEVEDDGRGLANSDSGFTAETRASLGVGIPGMRERLRELGGALDIRSGPRGTHIIARVPQGKTKEETEPSPKPRPNVVPKRAKRAGASRPACVRKRVLVVDDHELVRRGVRALIENEPDLEVCGEAGDVIEAVQLTLQLKPDVILLDLQMPSGSGWQVVLDIRKFDFWTKVVIFTAFHHPATIAAAQTAKCEGFVVKSQAGSTVAKALHEVLSGHSSYPEGSGPQKTTKDGSLPRVRRASQ